MPTSTPRCPCSSTPIVQNAGQTCSAGSRLLVRAVVYEALLERLAEAFASCASGRPLMDLDVGPLIRAASSSDVVERLPRPTRSDAGIAVVAQGAVVGRGAARPATTAPDAAARRAGRSHRLAQEEVFGPVLAAMSFDDEDRGGRASPTARSSAWSPASGRATAAAQLRMAKRVQERPGLHQQLRRRRRRRAALRRRQVLGLRPREGLRGAVRLHHPQDRGDPPRMKHLSYTV